MDTIGSVTARQERKLSLARFRPPPGALSLVLVLGLYLFSHDVLDRLGPHEAPAHSDAPEWPAQADRSGTVRIAVRN